MVSISDLFGWTGAFISICFFCYPIINFVKLIKKKITYKDVNIIIILGNYISSIVWLIYGYKISCTQLIVCYSIGAFISLVWLWIYLIHMGKQKMTLTLIYALFLSVLTFGLYIVLAIIIDDKDTLGEVCFIVCSLSYISPTQLLIKVLNKKDYRIIPIISAVISSLGFGSWTFFGLFQFSAAIIIPNLVGFIFSGAQIVLYRVYKNKKPSSPIKQLKKSVNNINTEFKPLSFQKYFPFPSIFPSENFPIYLSPNTHSYFPSPSLISFLKFPSYLSPFLYLQKPFPSFISFTHCPS